MNQQRWSIDADSASIAFVATSTVHPIHSRGTASGWFEAALEKEEFTPGESLHGRLEIPVGDLSSGNPLVDREMRKRVDTTTHPLIIAEIETTGAVDGNTATITGTIRFLGTEALVEGELIVLPGPRLTGVGEFDVRWWALDPPRMLMLRVDPIVTVQIDLPLI
ncbi:MAG: YceI family protein [Actinomycetota bacterium]|nr:YceI family protein [Actinomycetota bacterium]